MTRNAAGVGNGRVIHREAVVLKEVSETTKAHTQKLGQQINPCVRLMTRAHCPDFGSFKESIIQEFIVLRCAAPHGA